MNTPYKLGNTLSEPRPVKCGVPQGSILGPTLFILYTNGILEKMPMSTPNGVAVSYADDTQCLEQFRPNCLTDMLQQAGRNLELTRLRFAEMNLKMNAAKTQGLLCGKKLLLSRVPGLPAMDIGGKSLELETVVKDLGVLLDSHMTFSAHAEHIARQMSGTLCYLSRIRHFLTKEATVLLVQTLVLTRLDYCSAVWGGLDKVLVNKLQRAVNFAARVIFRAKKRDPVTPLLRQLNWLSVQNRLILNTGCFMFRVANGRVPDPIVDLFTRVHEVSQRNTRQSQDFHVPLVRTKAGRRSLSYRGAVLWTEIPHAIKLRPNLSSFKRAYKKHLLRKQHPL